MNYSCTAYELKCNDCGKRFGNQPLSACPDCLAPLEVAYDLDAVRGVFTREAIAAGPPSIWRYAALLPIPAGYQPDLPVGFTPLIKANNLGKRIGATNLYVKNDAVCFPTLSFKDRVVSVALANAQRFGFDTVGCSSTGNLANSVAAQAARLGIKACILVPAELEAAKILNTQVYGARLVRIDGNYDHVNRLCSQIADEYNWGFVNVNLRPYYAEGSKTVGYEIAEKLGWRLPDNVVVPMAGGSLIRKIRKAFQELIYLGLVEEKHVRFFGAQATGCSPISQAVKLGNDFIEPQRPNTIARSLAIGNPADGPAASQMIRATGGWAEDVSDVEIVSGMQELAETEGIFTETAGGVTTAVTARLYAHGRISPDEITVACITGNGLKTTDALTGHYREERAVRPRLADFDAYLRELDGAAEPELAAVGGTHGN
ncbi:threonine synthase [Edaphobacter dinghuensis]|uniref:Threonine synthase n=1 Tax=Edaphobacter dinghuensis TaxID=1560005 RepID=A0A917HC62_9BACT|nr:threonine synthase [Edaphobacter dinghuensis]GGG74179.1 threonine synthase [Edaphobacter dinghuensis]